MVFPAIASNSAQWPLEQRNVFQPSPSRNWVGSGITFFHDFQLLFEIMAFHIFLGRKNLGIFWEELGLVSLNANLHEDFKHLLRSFYFWKTLCWVIPQRIGIFLAVQNFFLKFFILKQFSNFKYYYFVVVISIFPGDSFPCGLKFPVNI